MKIDLRNYWPRITTFGIFYITMVFFGGTLKQPLNIINYILWTIVMIFIVIISYIELEYYKKLEG